MRNYLRFGLVTSLSGRGLAVLAAAWLLIAPAAAAEPDPLPEIVDFNRDIRPILSDSCFHCHGPDPSQRKADLRLDTEAGALANLSGIATLVPGKPDDSELFRRIASTDNGERMPPAKSGREPLTPRQIALVRKWIEQGAQWQKHWSLIPPVRPEVPPFQGDGWEQNPIDAFIRARLRRENLQPSPRAEKAVLIRRVTLDLTGLPPTPAEVDAFLADNSPRAFETVVDRLLASPRYGERMASRWLDAARYADTNGYQSDGIRYMWRWRDWVIEAYNRNLPFDQFTIEQLAGDLLPNPTLDQRIATGFNRNHRGNAEGGIIPEEYAVEYVVDRVDTTATVWLGLTMGCARCHDHKYDPISQQDYYQVFALFNNVPERGRAIKYGNSPPVIKAPTREEQQLLQALAIQLAGAEAHFATLQTDLAQAQAAWEKAQAAGGDTLDAIHGAPARHLALHYPLDHDARNHTDTAPATSTAGNAPALPEFVPGRLARAAQFDGTRFIDAGDVAHFDYFDKFTFSAWIYPVGDQGGTILSRMTDTPSGDGYNFALVDGRLQVNLVKRWLDDALRVETDRQLPADRWSHVLFTYDGSRFAEGVQIYVDGQPEKLRVLLDELNQPFENKQPFRIGTSGPNGGFHGRIDDLRCYTAVLPAEDITRLATPETIAELVAIPAEKRTAAQARKLAAWFLETRAPQRIRSAWKQVLALRDEHAAYLDSVSTCMVMEELPQPRPTFILQRGEYDKPGARVTPGIPAQLAAGEAPVIHNRLDLARWLVSPNHPLTARVAVNRFWQMYFNTGLVKTVDDFGSQGEWPSHPELLDWLATEFIRSGWDVKHLQKLIVMSAAYQQSSRVTPALLQKDPDNRLLARGPRGRLSAEMIRDQALAVSGLLVEKQGGPSVLPYQPPGLWKELTGIDFTQDHGEKLYRRSLYTFWKRTVAPPTMMTFDASGREMCLVRETRTNTPLQALTLLNEITFVEAARVLAQRVLTSPAATPADRLTLAFRLTLGRAPRPAELDILQAGLASYLEHYRQHPDAAAQLVRIGESPVNPALNPGELAAWTAVASLLLNLDETVTKE